MSDPPVRRLTARLRRLRIRILHDAMLNATGLPVSLLVMPVLVGLTAPAIATVPIWIGLLLLPVALIFASAAADLSRLRARRWGAPVPEVVRPTPAPSLGGWIGVAADGRRWLDLLFEMLIALPLRTLTFGVSLSWFGGALGGLTYWLWGRLLPASDIGLTELILIALTDKQDEDLTFADAAWIQAAEGAILLVSLPLVLRAMALIEIAAIRAGLGTAPAPGEGPAPVALDPSTLAPSTLDPSTLDPRTLAPGTLATSTLASEAPVPAAQAPAAGTLAAPRSSPVPVTAPATSEPTPPGPTPIVPGPTPAASAPGPPATTAPTPSRPTPTPPAGAQRPASGLTGSVEGIFWLAAVFAAIVLFAVGWPVTAVVYGTWPPAALLLCLAQSAALILAVRYPIAAIATATGASAAGILLTADSHGPPWPWTVTALLAVLLVHAILGLRHAWPHLGILATLTLALSFTGPLLPHPGAAGGVWGNAITAAALTVVVALVTFALRVLLRGRGELESVRRISAEEAAKRQHLEERNRIAQELHDVVAHSMSVISVQATTARYRNPATDPASVEEFESIAASARQALTEMRGLLAILRGGRDAELAPQPVIADIPALVTATREAGAEVELTFPSTLPEVTTVTSLTAFRIVQEGLSNALRHAPGAPITVTLHAEAGHLHVTVLNEAPAARTGSARLPVGGPSGAGFGLAGMRERVLAIGGSLIVGPTGTGGFQVAASLPTD